VYSTRALEIYEALGSLPDVATVQNNIGVRLYSEGRWGDALEAFRQAQQAHAKAGDQAHAAATGANIGQVLIDQGQIGEATEILVDAVRILRAHNLVEHSINAEIQLARARLRAGDIERGQGDLERLFEQASSMAMDDMVLEAAMSLAEIHIRRGDGSGALALLSEVEKRAADVIAFYEAGLANVKARALAACEMVSEALDQVDRGLPIAREQGLAYEEALLLRTKAGLKELAGEDNAAELAASDEILSRLGVLRAGSE
jgi:tetratricopeptide (TPR) repeat protein